MNHAALKAIVFAGLIATQVSVLSANADWTWMKGANTTNQIGTYGTQGTADPANTPGARYCAVSWIDAAGALWLFGGGGYPASGGVGYLNDLWKYASFCGVISLDTNALAFSTTYGVNPAAQRVGMTNVGGSAFTYTNVIAYSAGASGWLTVLPSDGTVALDGATVLTNYVNITGLGVGTYYATNKVTAADATKSPQTVVITLTVGVPVVPVAGDFDGDGKADFAVVDPAGVWTIWMSKYDYAPAHIGPFYVAGGVAVAGDFDGDGLADPAMVAANGVWTIWMSSASYTPVRTIPLYVAGGVAVAGDFDGDGLADPAIVAANGVWKIWMSSADYAPVSTIPLIP